MLEVLALKNCTVILDAMGCQKKIAKAIRAGEADYELRHKDNHPVVRQEVEAFFDPGLARAPQALAIDEHSDGGHGRGVGRRGWRRGHLAWCADLDK